MIGYLRRASLLTAMLIACLFAAQPARAQTSASAFVYWPNIQSGTIGRGTTDGNPANVNQNFIRVGTDVLSVFNLVVDRQYIYWTGAPGIGRAKLDGSEVNPRFIPFGTGAPLNLTVGGEHIYWANFLGQIGRANLDGSDVNTNFIGGLRSTGGIAVDGQHIYWSDFFLANTIGRANLDGSGVNDSFLTVPSGGVTGAVVLGLAVDYGHIYWANPTAGMIGRANLDGSNFNPSFITGAVSPVGVAVDYEHVYWANNWPPPPEASNGMIGRANLDGSGVNPNFITPDTRVGPGCRQEAQLRCGPTSVAATVPAGPFCMRQDPPPPPPFMGAVFARPLDPASANANVVVIPAGATWSQAAGCAGISQGSSNVIANPTYIAVAEGAAVLLKDASGLLSAWGGKNVGPGDPAPIFFPGRTAFSPNEVAVMAADTFLRTYNGCRGCTLPDDISFTPAASNPNIGYQGDVSGASLTGATLTGRFTAWNMSGAELTGAVLSGADLTGVNLTGAVLSGATLDGTVVDRAVFDRADLRGAQITGLRRSAPPSFSGVRIGSFNGKCTKFENTDFRNARLAPIKPDSGCQTSPLLPGSTAPLDVLTLLARTYQSPLDYSDARFVVDAGNRGGLAGADLHGINLVGVSFLGFPADFSRTNFDGASLQETSFDLADLSGATFRNAIAPGASFAGARLAAHGNVPGASFAGASTSLVGASFVGADVSGASFQSADLSNAAFNRVLAQGTDFNSVKAPNAVFNGAHIYGDGQAFDSAIDLRGVDFVNAVLAGDASQGGFDLSGADLTGAKFDGAQCIGCNFAKSTLDGASFSGSYLLGAVFSAATLQRANLLDAWLYCGDLANSSCTKAPGSQPRWTWALALGVGEQFGPVPFVTTDLVGVTLDDVTACPDGKDGAIAPAGCDNHLLPDPNEAPPIPAACSAAGLGACPTSTSTIFDAASVGAPLAVAAATPPVWVSTLTARGYYAAFDDGTVRLVDEGSSRIVAGSAGRHCPTPTQACGDGGPATQALLGKPTGLAVDLDGSLYLADPVLNRVRRIDPSGRITTVAGTGASCGPSAVAPVQPKPPSPLLERALSQPSGQRVADSAPPRIGANGCGDGGPATSAALSGPYGVWVDPSGLLWIADGRSGIRQVRADGTITTECCQLGAGGLGLLWGVAGDNLDNLYATSNDPDYLVKIDLSTGKAAVAVGTGTSGYNGNTDSSGSLLPGRSVQVNQPKGLSVGLNGNVVFADAGNNLVRAYVPASDHVVDLGGVVANTVPQRGFNGDGRYADATQLNNPQAVTVTRGALFVLADTSNARIRQLGPGPPAEGTIRAVRPRRASGDPQKRFQPKRR